MNPNNGGMEGNTTDLKSGPFSVLYKAVRGNTQILVNVRNNHKLLGRVKAYDRHMNLLLEDVKEMWTESSKGGKGKSRGMAVNKDRYVSKMFLRGDSVILIVSNPAALANPADGGGGSTTSGGDGGGSTTKDGGESSTTTPMVT